MTVKSSTQAHTSGQMAEPGQKHIQPCPCHASPTTEPHFHNLHHHTTDLALLRSAPVLSKHSDEPAAHGGAITVGQCLRKGVMVDWAAGQNSGKMHHMIWGDAHLHSRQRALHSAQHNYRRCKPRQEPCRAGVRTRRLPRTATRTWPQIQELIIRSGWQSTSSVRSTSRCEVIPPSSA